MISSNKLDCVNNQTFEFNDKKNVKVLTALDEAVELIANTSIEAFVLYLSDRILISIGLLNVNINNLNPKDYIVFALFNNIIKKMGSRIYNLGLRILGDRKVVLRKDYPLQGKWGRQRQAWRIIARTEKLLERIDKAVSSILKIRTLKQLKKVKNRDSYSTIEILRHSILNVPQSLVPLVLTARVMSVCGFKNPVMFRYCLGIKSFIIFSIWNILTDVYIHYQKQNLKQLVK